MKNKDIRAFRPMAFFGFAGRTSDARPAKAEENIHPRLGRILSRQFSDLPSSVSCRLRSQTRELIGIPAARLADWGVTRQFLLPFKRIFKPMAFFVASELRAVDFIGRSGASGWSRWRLITANQ